MASELVWTAWAAIGLLCPGSTRNPIGRKILSALSARSTASAMADGQRTAPAFGIEGIMRPVRGCAEIGRGGGRGLAASRSDCGRDADGGAEQAVRPRLR